MSLNKFDVVLVPFPFSDKHASKKRPAVALSNREFIKESGHVILAMITTKGSWPHDVEITDLQASGLNVECLIRLKLFTLDVQLIDKKIGQLATKDRKALTKSLFACL